MQSQKDTKPIEEKDQFHETLFEAISEFSEKTKKGASQLELRMIYNLIWTNLKVRVEKNEPIDLHYYFEDEKISLLEKIAADGNLDIFMEIITYVSLNAKFSRESNDEDSQKGILYWACLNPVDDHKKSILDYLKWSYEKRGLNDDGITKDHIRAALGEAPTSEEAKSQRDCFGLYPFHYAALSGEKFLQWIPNELKQNSAYATMTGTGLFEGVNLYWLMARSERFKEDLFLNLKHFDLNVKPLAPQFLSKEIDGLSIAGLLYHYKKYSVLKNYIQKYRPVKLNLNEPFHNDPKFSGASLAFAILEDSFRYPIVGEILYNYFIHSETPPINLNARPEKDVFSGISFAYSLLISKIPNKIDIFRAALKKDPHFCLDLNAAPKDSFQHTYGMTLAHILIMNALDDILKEQLKKQPDVCLELNSKPLNYPNAETLAETLIMTGRFEILKNELEKYRKQKIDISKLDLDSTHKILLVTCAYVLARDKQFDLLEILADEGVCFNLNAYPAQENSEYGFATVANLIYKEKPKLLFKLMEKFKIDKVFLNGKTKKPTSKKELEKRAQQREKTVNTDINQKTESKPQNTEVKPEINQFLNEVNHLNIGILEIRTILTDIDIQFQKNKKLENIINNALPYADTDKKKEGKRNLITKFANDIKKLNETFKKIPLQYQNLQERLCNLEKMIKEIKHDDQDTLQKLRDSIRELQEESKIQLTFLTEFENKVKVAYDKFKKNNKIVQARTQTQKSRGKSKRQQSQPQGKSKAQTEVSKQTAQGPKTKQTDVPEQIQRPKTRQPDKSNAKERRRAKRKELSGNNDNAKSQVSSTNPDTVTVTVIPPRKGLPIPPYAGHPSTLYPSGSTESLSKSEAKPKPTPDECKKEIEKRRKSLFSCPPFTNNEDEFEITKRKAVIKLNLLKLTEAYKHLKNTGTQEERTIIANLRNLLCHEPYSLDENELQALLNKFKQFYEDSEQEKESRIQNDESHISIQALVKSINEIDSIKNKIKKYIEAGREHQGPTELQFSDFFDHEEFCRNLTKDLETMNYIYSDKIVELTAKEGNALAVIRNLPKNHSDLYDFCEFLILSIEENMKKLNIKGSISPEIEQKIRELRNKIAHENQSMIMLGFFQILPDLLQNLRQNTNINFHKRRN